jgi:hypothetical protein
MHRSSSNTVGTDSYRSSHFVRTDRCATSHVVGSRGHVLGSPASDKQDGSKHQNSHKRIHFYFHTDVTDRYSFNDLK